jgi:hypothetical protein
MTIFNFEILEISEVLKISLLFVELSSPNKKPTLVSLLNMVLEEILLLVLILIHVQDFLSSVFSGVVWGLLLSTIITFNNDVFVLFYLCMIEDITELVMLFIIEFSL